MVKEKEFKPEKEFKRGYDFKEPELNAKKIPGMNEIQINQAISIET